MVVLLLLLVIVAAAGPAGSAPLEFPVTVTADDGEELDDRTWVADADLLTLGRPGDGHVHDLGLRFEAPGLLGVDEVVFARLRFSGWDGAITDGFDVRVTAALEADSPPLGATRRPSQLPRTTAARDMTIDQAWRHGGTTQHFHYTPDLAPVINEVVAQAGWGAGDHGPALVLCLDALTAGLDVGEHVQATALAPGRWPATLQVCRTLAETFEAGEQLGRPTERSVTVNFASLVDLEVRVEYGVGLPTQQTAARVFPGGRAGEIVIDRLRPDTEYAYRLSYRRAGSGDRWQSNPQRRFRTARAPGSPFTFTVHADSHIWESWGTGEPVAGEMDLFARTLANVANDRPDFHIAMGDEAMAEYCGSFGNARDRYLALRRFLDPVTHSAPFYLVLGNHEGELGYFMAEGDSAAVWAERARREMVANPAPDVFYDGCAEPPATGAGHRESYYSWEWGDALFVVLDPYWYTTQRPFHNAVPELGTGWAWTLGRAQYEWLHQVLTASDRTWKIVLLHQLVGGVAPPNAAYGRGGIEAARFRVDRRPSFEWGGENETGQNVFDVKRFGWQHGPIHDLLRSHGVKLVVFGHDHLYANQELDGVTYLTCPQPQDHSYGYGGMLPGGYERGTLLPNAGHVRFRVAPTTLDIEYVSAFLPGDGLNGMVAHTKRLTAPGAAAKAAAGDAVATVPLLRVMPSPAAAGEDVVLRVDGLPAGAAKAAAVGQLEAGIYDVAGRLVARLRADADGSFAWNQCDGRGRRVAAGVYHCRVTAGDTVLRGRVVVVR
jgi:3',5'-cyclic AMP phosphodiesterase CpdA